MDFQARVFFRNTTKESWALDLNQDEGLVQDRMPLSMVIKSAINERGSLAFTIRWSWPETLDPQETHRSAV